MHLEAVDLDLTRRRDSVDGRDLAGECYLSEEEEEEKGLPREMPAIQALLNKQKLLSIRITFSISPLLTGIG